MVSANEVEVVLRLTPSLCPHLPRGSVARRLVHGVLEELQRRLLSLAQFVQLGLAQHGEWLDGGVLERALHRGGAVFDVVQELRVSETPSADIVVLRELEEEHARALRVLAHRHGILQTMRESGC